MPQGGGWGGGGFGGGGGGGGGVGGGVSEGGGGGGGGWGFTNFPRPLPIIMTGKKARMCGAESRRRKHPGKEGSANATDWTVERARLTISNEPQWAVRRLFIVLSPLMEEKGRIASGSSQSKEQQ